MNGCPDKQALLDWIAGRLPADRARQVEAHAAQCANCAPEVDRLRALSLTMPAGNRPPESDEGVADTCAFLSTSDEFDFSVLTPSENRQSLGKLGKYDILSVIGAGGFGVVLKAWDDQLRRSVAIKVLNRAFSSNAVARRRFIREARAAASVNHPNVVTIHAVEEHSGKPFLVMELVSGPSLRERIRSGPKPTPLECVRLCAQIAAGLAAAHAQGVIHRDIKPGNIMLEGTLERVKITDFGLARVAIDNVDLTSRELAVGTPAYMSPEQITGGNVDARNDLFGLGCVIYAMLTGHSPFHGRSALEIARLVMDHQPPKLTDIDPTVPPFLSQIVARLLEKNPDNRFQSAAEVADLLQRHLVQLNQTPSDQMALVLRSPTLTEGQPTRRNWRPIVLTLALIAAVGASWGVWKNRWPANGAAVPEISHPDTPTAPQAPEAYPAEITVSRTATADVRSLGDALGRAGPRTVIRVLDDATYSEAVVLNDPIRHQGIQLIAEQRAKLTLPKESGAILEIRDVADVVVRGFDFTAPQRGHAILVSGTTHGLTCEDLRSDQMPDAGAQSIVQIAATGRDPADRPLRFTRCTLACPGRGVAVWLDGRQPPVKAVEFRECRFSGQGSLLVAWGFLEDLELRNNVFLSGENAINLNLKEWLPETRLHIVNNTFLNSRFWLGFVKTNPNQPGGTVCNNLILGGERIQGSDQQISDAIANWVFRSNWWETSTQTRPDAGRSGQIAVMKESLQLMSRDPTHPQFLHPLPESELFSAGSGGEWPEYIGAVGP